jgi:hypothetical protein
MLEAQPDASSSRTASARAAAIGVEEVQAATSEEVLAEKTYRLTHRRLGKPFPRHSHLATASLRHDPLARRRIFEPQGEGGSY